MGENVVVRRDDAIEKARINSDQGTQRRPAGGVDQVDQRADDSVDITQELAAARTLELGQGALERLRPRRRAVPGLLGLVGVGLGGLGGRRGRLLLRGNGLRLSRARRREN